MRPITLVIILVAAIWGAFGLGYIAHADGVQAQPNGAVVEACPFSPGWNLVTLNGTPSLLPSCVQTVWRYESSDDRWYFWGRENAAYWNDLTEFHMGAGYWVWAKP